MAAEPAQVELGLEKSFLNPPCSESSKRKAPAPIATRDAKKKKPSFLGSQELITVNVTDVSSQRKESFSIHKNFICHYSPFFDAAFNGSFVEGETQSLDMEANPRVFSVLVNWIYSQTLEEEDIQDLDSDAQYQLWILADRVLVPRLQNATMRLLFANKRRPSLRKDTLQYVYENTTKGSPLRTRLVEHYTSLGSFIKHRKYEDWPLEMLAEMIRVLGQALYKIGHNPSTKGAAILEDYLLSEELPERKGRS